MDERAIGFLPGIGVVKPSRRLQVWFAPEPRPAALEVSVPDLGLDRLDRTAATG